jgi:ParB family transcriptional regulator, chromosome partitioning protein
MADKRPALGKGLSALIPDEPATMPASADVDIDLLAPNEQQPRGALDEARLDELTQSIRANGVIQPIVVRRDGDRYRIIAGERRWRAAQRAGLRTVPVAIRDVDAGSRQQLLELALIENIQREDLNPIEQAAAYRRLGDEFHLTQDEISAAVGKDRSSIANYVRLLKLPEEVRTSVAGGELSMGHARALLGLSDEAAQRQLAREIVSRGLTVRETETLVRRAAEPPAPTKPPREPERNDVHTRAAEETLRIALGTRVRIVRKGKGGRIEVDFVSEDELQRLYEALTDRR